MFAPAIEELCTSAGWATSSGGCSVSRGGVSPRSGGRSRRLQHDSWNQSCKLVNTQRQTVRSELTSHERHCIMVSRSFCASYVRPQRQNVPWKFCPYSLVAFSSSCLRCRMHEFFIAVVGQSQRKFRLGNLTQIQSTGQETHAKNAYNSSCSWSV